MGGRREAAVNTQQQLRPYQQDAIAAIIDAWHRGKTPLIVIPTGGGKTTIFATLLAEHFNPQTQRALVLADTIELVWQPYERIRQQLGSRADNFHITNSSLAPCVGVVMGANDAVDARIVVATRQSLRRTRFERMLEHGAFDIVIIDEAHTVAAGGSFVDIVAWARAANPNVKVMGCTATPKRTDNKALAIIFDEISYNYRILDAIKDGWLVPPTRLAIRTTVNLSGIKTVSGDYKSDDLIAALDAANWVDLAVKAFKDHILEAQRPALAYFPGVQESKDFTLALQAEGIAAGHVDGETPDDQRAEMLAAYKRGDLRVVSNCAVLTKGFDAPSTSAILLARPTKSETLLTQIIGRGLRLSPGKADCLIVDLTPADTQALTIATLTGAMEHCDECGAEFYKGLTHCPICGAEVAKKTKTKPCRQCDAQIPITAKVCPECGYVYPASLGFDFSANKDYGEGLYTEVASLFGNLAAAWYRDDEGYMSTSVGEFGTLYICPPTGADGGWLRQRRQNGFNLLSRIDPELVNDLKDQISQVERMIRRADGYSLYYCVPSRRTETGGWSQGSVEYLRSNEDLASLIAEADLEAIKRAGEAKALTKKDSNWRLLPASDGQIRYLRTLGVRQVDPRITKGEAAQQITHLLAAKDVHRYVLADTLPAPKSEYA